MTPNEDAKRARNWLEIAGGVSADSINDVKAEAMICALTGIGYALLAVSQHLSAVEAEIKNGRCNC